MAERFTYFHITHPSAAETVTGQSAALDVSTANEGMALLSVTAASGTVPTLDVKVQVSADGTAWFDEGTAFTQAVAAVTPAAKKLTNFGAFMRYVWTITGTTPSFTFVITTVLKK